MERNGVAPDEALPAVTCPDAGELPSVARDVAERSPARGAAVAWAYLAICLAGGLAYAWLDGMGSAAAVPSVIGASVLLALGIGPVWHRVEHPWPWRVIAVAVVLWLVAAMLRGDEVGTAPLRSDLVSILGYLLVLGSCVQLLRTRQVAQHRGAGLDGLVLCLASALTVWRLFVDPALHGAGEGARHVLFNLAYPVIDILLLLLLAQLAFTDASRVPAYWLFSGSFGALLAGDFLWNSAAAGAVVSAVTLNSAYVVGYALLGAAMLHPSVRFLTRAQPEREALPLARAAVLACALAGPAILAVLRPGHSALDRLLTVGFALTLALLVLSRAARALRGSARDAERFLHAATHDELTGLPNRRLLMDRLEVSLARVARDGGDCALLFADLDGFKLVNDSWGHETGDELLTLVANRLRAMVQLDHVVARIGGDGFVVLIESEYASADAISVSEQMLDELAAAFELSHGEVFITPSIGACWRSGDAVRADLANRRLATPGAGRSTRSRTASLAAADRLAQAEIVHRIAAEMVRDADTAMYEAKARGRRQIVVFDASLRERVRKQLDLENALRRGLEREEFTLHYQPIVALATGRLLGWEALLRWTRPDVGPVSPIEFIPAAEETGLIVPLGDWVLHEALAQMARWQRVLRSRGYAAEAGGLTMSVNVAPRQLSHGDFPATARAALALSSVPAGALCLEVTESALLDEDETTGAALRELSAGGSQLAIDDFGTGYSSLSYLRRFPFTRVKIDRSFVSNLATSTDDARIVEAAIAMAGALQLSLVAEGIETVEQSEILRALGCTTGQGYLFGRPLASSAATADLFDRMAAAAAEDRVREVPPPRHATTAWRAPARSPGCPSAPSAQGATG